MKIAPFFLALGLFMQTTVFATPLPTQPLLEIVDFDYQGEQCQQLNSDLEYEPSIVENEDEQVLEIPFGTSFDAFTDEHNYQVVKPCKVEVTLKVPEGYQVAPNYVTYLGAAIISPEGTGTVTAHYSLAGEVSPKAVETFPGGFADGFVVKSPYATDSQWSECGGEVELIAIASINVFRSPTEAGIADTEILADMLLLGYSLRPCDSDPNTQRKKRNPNDPINGCPDEVIQSQSPGVTACYQHIENEILDGVNVNSRHYFECTGTTVECCKPISRNVAICHDVTPLTGVPGGKPSQPGPIDPIGPTKPTIP
jgi:hypothetical protein